ncbi:MAG: S41 family peptidase, partial [Cellvibrionaceae bacterium]|nr:S41 family peptidase [Cellvibrionaceae bacterium]
MNLRLRFQLIILVCLLGAFSLVFAGPNDAKSAYDQVQKARDLAWEKFDSDSGSLGLEEGLRLLDEAEEFLDSAVVFDLANGSYFLRNRKFHLFMDRGLAYLKYGKRDEAVKQFSSMLREEFSPDIFDFLVGEVGVEELKDIEEIQSLNRLAKSMGRVWGKGSFSRDYSADISVGEKIAGLSTFWSNAKFSFAYFDQVPNLDWDEVYKSYVDRVINTRSTEEYYRVLMTLAPLLEDGHTNIYPPSELQKRFWSRPPVRTKLIQGKVVITDIYSEKVRASGVALGDIVLEINGVEVNKYVKENVAPYVSSSTSQDREVREYRYSLLSGPADEKVAVLVERDGKSYSLEFKRTPYGDEVYPLPFSFRKEKNDSIYIDVRTFSNDEAYRFLLEQYESLKSSKSLIIDLRSNDGGSTANAYKLLSLLVD